MTRARLLSDAACLVIDSAEQLAATVEHAPDREATARQVLNDAVRAHLLLSSERPWRCIANEVADRLERAGFLTEALRRPVI